MRIETFTKQRRLCFVAFTVLTFVFSLSGCGTKTTPPGADTIGTTAQGMNIAFLRWKEGLMVLFVDDVKGSHHSNGSGSTENPIHTATISAGPEIAGFRCQLETTDGKSAICRINGKKYDLSNGALFVIKAGANRSRSIN